LWALWRRGVWRADFRPCASARLAENFTRAYNQDMEVGVLSSHWMARRNGLLFWQEQRPYSA